MMTLAEGDIDQMTDINAHHCYQYY